MKGGELDETCSTKQERLSQDSWHSKNKASYES